MTFVPEETAVTVLSHADSFTPLGELSSMFSYILDRSENELVQESSIRMAAEGVARKWRLWAGRVEWDAKLDRWTVRVPLGPLPPAGDYPLVHLTFSTSTKPCPKQFIRTPTRSTCSLTPASDRSLSAHPSASLDLPALAKRAAPLVQIHLNTFSDFQIIGICICHGIADGKSLGMWARAFSAELNAKEWDAPPVETASRVDAAVAALQAQQGEMELAAGAARSVGPGGLLDGAVPASVWNIVKAGCALTLEHVWHGVQDGGAFLGHDVVDWLVARTKKEVEDATGGEEFVSTYDILVAWLLKSAYADEPNHSPLKPTGVMCVRSTLSAATAHGGPSLLSRPLALNAAWFYNFASGPAGPNPYSASLADLALRHRRALSATRTPSSLAANFHWLEGFHARGERAPLFVSTGVDCWGFSNQVECGVADAIDWGRGKGKAQLYTCRQAPEFKDNMCIVTRQEKGWVWTGMLRKSRWASIGKALARLEAEWRADTQADGKARERREFGSLRIS